MSAARADKVSAWLFASQRHSPSRAAASARLATVSLRPRAVIGPRDTVLLPRLLRAARTGVLPMPGQGGALIELTDARDVVDAFLAAEARAARQAAMDSLGDMSTPPEEVDVFEIENCGDSDLDEAKAKLTSAWQRVRYIRLPQHLMDSNLR